MDGKVYIGGLPNDATSQEVNLFRLFLVFSSFIFCIYLYVSRLRMFSTVSEEFAKSGSLEDHQDSLSSSSKMAEMPKMQSSL